MDDDRASADAGVEVMNRDMEADIARTLAEPENYWIGEVVQGAADPDTAADLRALLVLARTLVISDSVQERRLAEARMSGRLSRLRRIYSRRSA